MNIKNQTKAWKETYEKFFFSSNQCTPFKVFSEQTQWDYCTEYQVLFFFFLLGFLRVLKLVQHKTKVPSPRLQRKTHQKRRIWCLASTKDNINMETKFPHTLISFYRLWEKGSYPKWLFCIRSLSIPSPQLYFFWVFIHAFNSSDEWNWSIVFAWK